MTHGSCREVCTCRAALRPDAKADDVELKAGSARRLQVSSESVACRHVWPDRSYICASRRRMSAMRFTLRFHHTGVTRSRVSFSTFRDRSTNASSLVQFSTFVSSCAIGTGTMAHDTRLGAYMAAAPHHTLSTPKSDPPACCTDASAVHSLSPLTRNLRRPARAPWVRQSVLTVWTRRDNATGPAQPASAASRCTVAYHVGRGLSFQTTSLCRWWPRRVA